MKIRKSRKLFVLALSVLVPNVYGAENTTTVADEDSIPFEKRLERDFGIISSVIFIERTEVNRLGLRFFSSSRISLEVSGAYHESVDKTFSEEGRISEEDYYRDIELSIRRYVGSEKTPFFLGLGIAKGQNLTKKVLESGDRRRVIIGDERERVKQDFERIMFLVGMEHHLSEELSIGVSASYSVKRYRLDLDGVDEMTDSDYGNYGISANYRF